MQPRVRTGQEERRTEIHQPAPAKEVDTAAAIDAEEARQAESSYNTRRKEKKPKPVSWGLTQTPAFYAAGLLFLVGR
jgi:hypothetical protein